MTHPLTSLLARLRQQQAELDAKITDLEVSLVAEWPVWPKRITLPARLSEYGACPAAVTLGLSGAVLRHFSRACAQIEVDVEVDEDGTIRFLTPPRCLYVREQAE